MTKTIKVQNCGDCVFEYDMDTCAIPDTEHDIEKSWMDDELHPKCPLREADVLVSLDTQEDE